MDNIWIYVIIWLVYALIFGVLTRQHMINKGYDDSGGGWLYLGFMLGIFGFIIAYSKPNLKKEKQEELMNAVLQNNLNQTAASWKCSCGFSNPLNVTFCVNCGKKKQVADTSNSISEQINEIKNLYDQGLITEDEYNAKKKQILGL